MYKCLYRHIQKFPSHEWDFFLLSNHPYLHLSTLKELSDKPWCWGVITKNPNFSWEWVRALPDKPWNWNHMSSLSFFSWKWVREFPDKPWDWNNLSDRDDITIDIIKEFPDKPWNWYILTMHPEIDTKIMSENPNLPWRINELLFSDVDENIINYLRLFRSHYDKEAWLDHTLRTPWRLIKENFDLPWELEFIKLRSTSDFTEEDIQNFLCNNNEKKWNWLHLSEMIDYTLIRKYPDLPWNWKVVSMNRTLDYRDVCNDASKFNLNIVNLTSEKKEWNASNTIKRYWKKCVTDPSYKLCKKVVLKDLFSLGFAEIDGINHEH